MKYDFYKHQSNSASELKRGLFTSSFPVRVWRVTACDVSSDLGPWDGVLVLHHKRGKHSGHFIWNSTTVLMSCLVSNN